MSRPAIPAEIRRAVLVEAGHRCAIPQCQHSDVDIHHIISWKVCKKHEYKNLLALCPNCHRRAHKGEIDPKSLRIYKSKLVDQFSVSDDSVFSATIIEVKHRIEEVDLSAPGFMFSFEFPDLKQPEERIVSRNIELWGNELLQDMKNDQKFSATEDKRYAPPPSWLRGTYEIYRRDTHVVSIIYNIERYLSGGAHRFTEIRVQNFSVSPFSPITIESLIVDQAALDKLSELSKRQLLNQAYPKLDPEHVNIGAGADWKNYACFLIGEYGIEFIFEEYLVASYAAGVQRVWFDFHALEHLIFPDLYLIIKEHDGL